LTQVKASVRVDDLLVAKGLLKKIEDHPLTKDVLLKWYIVDPTSNN